MRQLAFALLAPAVLAQGRLHEFVTPESLGGGGWGNRLADAGDVNDDGYADLLISLLGRRVRVFSGRDGAQLHDFDAVAAGDALAGAGDVDADGYDDVILGTYQTSGVWGSVVVHSGRTGAQLHRFTGQFGQPIGDVVAGLGDLDGDGHGDFAYTQISGTVRVVSGRTGTPLFTPTGSGAFGYALRGVGDVDGDSSPDFAVGAPDANRHHIYSGRTGAQLRVFTGSAAEQGLGEQLAGGGDVDGDGRADYVAASPLADTAGADSGTVVVFSGTTGARLWTFNGTAGDGLGSAIDLRDMDGDGRADVFVAARASNRVRVYSGRTGAILAEYGDAANTQFGASIAALDANCDGYADLAVSAPNQEKPFAGAPSRFGTVYVLSGNVATLSSLVLRHTAGLTGSSFGSALAGGQDIDNDGVSDFLVGAPNFGPPTTRIGMLQAYSGRTLSLIRSHFGREYNMGNPAYTALSADMNGDGRADYMGASIYNPGSGPIYYGEVFSGAGGTLYGYPRGVSGMSAAGDVDNDGRGDFIVRSAVTGNSDVISGASGALLYTITGGPGKGAGRVNGNAFADLVFTDAATTRLHEGQTGALLLTIAQPGGVPVGDVNGDGRADLLFPPHAGNPATVFTGDTGLRLRTYPGVPATAVFSGGDLDGDGVAEHVLAEPGTVRVFSGATGFALHTLTGNAAEGFGSVVAAAGDLNGDGRGDLLIGRPSDPTATGGSVLVLRSVLQVAPGKAITYGRPCRGSTGSAARIGAEVTPHLGTTWAVSLRGVLSGAPTVLLIGSGGAVDIDLSFLGAPGCRTLHLANLAALPVNANALGRVRVPINTPNDPGLVGLRLWWQWAAADFAANAAGFTASDGLQTTDGR